MQISAVRLSQEAFAPFGDYWPHSGARTGKGYSFSSALYPAFRGADDEEPSLGITVGEALDVATARMERHFHTTETLFTIATPIVLAVAPPGGEAPLADEVVAFLLNPGDVVRLSRGVWHDACRGIIEPATYGWLADCRAPLDPWVPIEGGPVTIRVTSDALLSFEDVVGAEPS